MQEIFVLAHVPTAPVNEGFLPAARTLGLSVILLTDCADAHRAHFASAGLPAYPDDVVSCDVFNPLAVIDAITRRGGKPAAVYSNSDHLQTATAIAAAYFGLPSKDWRTTYAAKNKAEMRRRLAESGIDTLWHAVVCDADGLAALANVPMPCIVKPREGVASQQVSLARSHAELAGHCGAIWARHPGQALLLEEYLEGPLYTLETLGDGKDIRALGGFRVSLSPPPYFVELEAVWGTGLPASVEAEVLDTIRRFGIGFGACHTEYVLTPKARVLSRSTTAASAIIASSCCPTRSSSRCSSRSCACTLARPCRRSRCRSGRPGSAISRPSRKARCGMRLRTASMKATACA